MEHMDVYSKEELRAAIGCVDDSGPFQIRLHHATGTTFYRFNYNGGYKKYRQDSRPNTFYMQDLRIRISFLQGRVKRTPKKAF